MVEMPDAQMQVEPTVMSRVEQQISLWSSFLEMKLEAQFDRSAETGLDCHRRSQRHTGPSRNTHCGAKYREQSGFNTHTHTP